MPNLKCSFTDMLMTLNLMLIKPGSLSVPTFFFILNLSENFYLFCAFHLNLFKEDSLVFFVTYSNIINKKQVDLSSEQ